MSTILTEAIQPVIACVASVAAFAWKSSERQRGRWREQHSAISAVLGRDLASVHDLEIESMSRVCFGRAIPAAELRTLASAGYSLPQLEAYAVARSCVRVTADGLIAYHGMYRNRAVRWGVGVAQVSGATACLWAVLSLIEVGSRIGAQGVPAILPVAAVLGWMAWLFLDAGSALGGGIRLAYQRPAPTPSLPRGASAPGFPPAAPLISASS